MRVRVWTVMLGCLLSVEAVVPVVAQHQAGYNYDEAKIAPYTMLDPLKMADGSAVRTPVEWAARRAEIVRLFEENEFGRTPETARKAVMHARVIEHDGHALGGLAVREQVELTFDAAPGIDPPTDAERMVRLLVYVPAASAAAHRPVPMVLGMNFGGNQTVAEDPGIQPTPVWSMAKGTTDLEHTEAAETTRGSKAQEWQVKMLLEHGYGLATFYYQDLEPDFKGAVGHSARLLYSTPAQLQQPDAWGSLALWAWGLSQAMNYLEVDPLVDAAQVAVIGHSRLGKAADWAFANDLRFAALLSNESGHGGQSIQRRALGETVGHLEGSFPYWFAPGYAKWVGHDAEIPEDGNLLLSLAAPRPVYVGSAEGDEWSDPKGEFLSAVSASRVYRLLGKEGLAADMARPGTNEPIGLEGFVAYHERTGKHDVTEFDWEHYLDLLDNRWGKPLERAAIGPQGLEPPPLPAHPASAEQIARWRTEVRRVLHVPEPLPAPETKTYESAEITPGVTAEKISYVTGYGLRVPAVVYRPTHAPAAKLPAIVVVNGHGGDKSSWYAYYAGIMYARAGAVVLTYDPIGEGERNDDHKDFTGEHDQLVPSPESMPVRLGGLMVTDVMQAVSTLAARPDVDARRIAVMGFSMGSFISSLAGAADPRIHALFLTGGGDLDGPDGYWDSGHAVMCQAAPYKALQVLGDRGAILMTLWARRGDTFMLNGTADTVVGIPSHGPDFFAALRQRVVELNGGTKGVFTTYFDPGASHRPSWVTPRVAEWLNQELEFPAWKGKDVAAMPTITVKDWAARVGFDLGKSGGREDRDAGLVTIESDVPLLTADQLDVMNRAQWEQENKPFLYSTWLERASAAAAEPGVVQRRAAR